MKRWAPPLLTSALLVASTHGLEPQTFDATKAVHEVKCSSFLGIFNKCVTMETDRLNSTFTKDKLGLYLLGRTWATASHCTRVDPTEQK